MTHIKTIGLVIAGLFVGLLINPVTGAILGGVYSQSVQNFTQGLYAGTSNQLTVESDGDIISTADATVDDLTVTNDATISGGSLTLTHTNAASSSLSVGCLQLYASSTVNPVKVFFLSQATTSYNGATLNGLLGWAFGTCP